ACCVAATFSMAFAADEVSNHSTRPLLRLCKTRLTVYKPPIPRPDIPARLLAGDDMAQNWTPNSWRQKPIKQVPAYPDAAALASAEERLASFPPLVFAGEARRLKKHLAQVAEGNAFL